MGDLSRPTKLEDESQDQAVANGSRYLLLQQLTNGTISRPQYSQIMVTTQQAMDVELTSNRCDGYGTKPLWEPLWPNAGIDIFRSSEAVPSDSLAVFDAEVDPVETHAQLRLSRTFALPWKDLGYHAWILVVHKFSIIDGLLNWKVHFFCQIWSNKCCMHDL